MFNRCFDSLDRELINEDEGIYTIGDDIAYSFVCGNYSQGIKELHDYCVSPSDFGEYLEEQSKEFGMPLSDMYYGHFDLSFLASIGQSYMEER